MRNNENKIKLVHRLKGNDGIHLIGNYGTYRGDQWLASDRVNREHDAHIFTLSEIANGIATLTFSTPDYDRSFPLPLVVDPADPADQQGLAHWTRIKNHIGESVSHDSHESPPELPKTQFESDVEALRNTVAYLLGRKNTIYNKLSLDITTDSEGYITHHEFKCEKTDGSEAIWVPNPIIGLIQKPNEKPCALLQFFDAVNDLVGEVRCEVGTNELAGFRKIIANGVAKTRSYTAAQAETFLYESEARESAPAES